MERGAAPAGVARNHALGRLRASCRAALRPLCEVLAERGQLGLPAIEARPREQRDWQPSSKGERGWNPGSPARSCGGDHSARNAAVERREARRPASLAGDPWRSEGSARPRGGPPGAAFRTSACRRSAPLVLARDGNRERAIPAALQKIQATGQRSVGLSGVSIQCQSSDVRGADCNRPPFGLGFDQFSWEILGNPAPDIPNC